MRTDRVPGLGIAKGLLFAFRQALPAEGDDPVPRGAQRHLAAPPRPPHPPVRRGRHAQVRDLLPVRGGLPDRVHRHGRRRHPRPLPRPLGPRRAVRRAPRGERAASLRAGSCRTRPSSRSSASTSPPLDAILAAEGYRPRSALTILERTQEAYGHLPVAALQHIAHQTGAWYSELYGIATSYPHLRFEPPTTHVVRVCRCTQCTLLGRRPRPRGVPRASRHRCRRHQPRRRRAPRDDRLRRRVERLAAASRSTARCCRARRSRMPSRSRPRSARTSRRAGRHEPADPDRRARLAERAARARRRASRPIPRTSSAPRGSAPGRPTATRCPTSRPTRSSASSASRGCAVAAAAGIRPGASGATARAAPERRRVVVANGFEADPGAQVDRTLMERDPHAVIEGARHRRVGGPGRGGHRRRACVGGDGRRAAARRDRRGRGARVRRGRSRR